ncbi:AI-2E family transporter [Nanohaloarchaea archaeon H01]|nr:AI-2E family transporter [Nanohaloarchaea archaeon H01]
MNRKKIFLFGLIGLAVGICFLMVSPYLGYILSGGVIAFILYPLKKKLSRHTDHASTLVTALTVVLAVLPFLIGVSFVANDASNLISSVDTQNLSIDYIDQKILELTGQEINIEERVRSSIQTIGSTMLSSISQIAGLASSFLIGISLLLFTEYYFLKEGNKIVDWTKKLDLMPTNIQEELYNKTGETTKSVIKGHILTAVASGLVAGIGLFIVGISNAVFWTAVMMVLGLIPLVGTTLVWGPAAVYLIINGNIYPGVFLLAYGLVVVGSVDNFLRPFLVDEEADLHPMFIILGVVGGIGVFGPIGVFIGPVMFGVAKSLITIYIEYYEEFS